MLYICIIEEIVIPCTYYVAIIKNKRCEVVSSRPSHVYSSKSIMAWTVVYVSWYTNATSREMGWMRGVY